MVLSGLLFALLSGPLASPKHNFLPGREGRSTPRKAQGNGVNYQSEVQEKAGKLTRAPFILRTCLPEASFCLVNRSVVVFGGHDRPHKEAE